MVTEIKIGESRIQALTV